MLKAQRFIPILMIAAGVWAYHNSLQVPFIFDDTTAISENPHVRHLWPIRDAVSPPPACAVSGRPVVCFTLALNYALGGWSVWGYHALNLTVHLLSALVLFGILRRTFEGEKLRDQFGGAAVWLAAVITLFWEVHPLQTESVTYVVQRTELLMGLFLLLTLYCALRGSQSSHPRTWYLAAVVSCALGMGSKEVMVAAPLIVLLYDRVFLASSFRELWRRRAVLYIGLAATWLILAVLVMMVPHPNTRLGINGLTPWDYLKTEAGVIVYYLRLCFWPHPLVIDYFDWPIARSLDDCFVPGIVVVGLLGATVWAFRRHPPLGFLGAWFFLILGPTSSFLPSLGEAAAERRMYLPLAAVVTMVVAGVFVLGKRLLNRQQGPLLGCMAGGAVVVLLTFLTVQRNRDYRSELTIWQDTVEKRPNNPRAHSNLGFVLGKAGKIQDAIWHYEQALRIMPNSAQAHGNLGVALEKLGRVQEAVAQYEQALRINPDFAEAHYNLGVALRQTGRIEDAIRQFNQALQINPNLAEAHCKLGEALAQEGKVPEAVTQMERALQLNPDYAEAHYGLGLALSQLENTTEAIRQYEQALGISPNYADALNNLAWLLATLTPAEGGDPGRALTLAQQACELTNYRAASYVDTLAAAYASVGRFNDAVATAQKGVELARSDGQRQVADEIEAHLRLYRNGRAYHRLQASR